MSTEPSERDQLIARAQELGIPQPWFTSTADLQEAVAAAEQTSAPQVDQTINPEDPDGQSKLAHDDPRAGTLDDPNVEDPYAHLRAPAAEEAEEE